MTDSIEKLLISIDEIDEINKINEVIDAINSGSSITIDSELSETSENPVQNKVITAALNNKQGLLTAGSGISISDEGVISNTQTSAEWGNITGTLSEQTDLMEVLESKQDILTAGNGISISDEGVISTNSSANWGNIQGDLSEQTDLMEVLDLKQDILTAGSGISISDNEISTIPYMAGSGIDIVDNTITLSDNLSYTALCPALSPSEGYCTWEITHNLGTQDIVVSLYAGDTEINKDVEIVSNNVINVSFAASSNVSAESRKVVIFANADFFPINNSDGQWVFANIMLSENAIETGIDLDLSSYLPNDNYNYEILLYGQINISSGVGSYRNLCVQSQIITAQTSICAVRQSSSTTATTSSTIIIPIGVNRKLTVSNRPDDVGIYTLLLRGYRRLGSNIPDADRSLNNLTNVGKIAIAHNAMPSSTYIDLELGVDGSSYTAPADGWYFIVSGATLNSDCFLRMDNTTVGISQQNQQWSGYGNCRLLLPVNKNDNMTVYYGNSSAIIFRFYYANGSESEAN